MDPRFSYVRLPEGDVIVGDIKEAKVPETLVCAYFGAKSSKSGWRYDAMTTPKEQKAIWALHQRVYECKDIPNKELTLHFARGLILMSKGQRVNWAQFSRERREYRQKLAKKRDQSTRERTELASGSGGEVIPPFIIGKRRCLAPTRTINEGFRTLLKLSIKAEGIEGLGVMGKKGSGKSRSVVVSLVWRKSDVDDVLCVVEERKVLVKELRSALVVSIATRTVLVDKLRRARLLHEDHKMIVKDSCAEIERILGEEHMLQLRIKERSQLLFVLESIQSRTEASKCSRIFLLAEQTNDVKKCEALSFQRNDEERSSRWYSKIIRICELDIASLEVELKETITQNEELSVKVKTLEGAELLVVGFFLQNMQEGIGHSFFPRPISGSLQLPVILVHTLNPCPMCSLWYSCWDFVLVSCGHCYHRSCLAELAKSSFTCLVATCNKPFLELQKVALGLQLTSKCIEATKEFVDEFVAKEANFKRKSSASSILITLI